MAKFCGKCGSKLDEKTGLCPKCNKKDDMSLWQKIKQFFLRMVLIIFLLGLLTSSITVALVYFDLIDIPVIEHLLNLAGVKEEKDVSGQDDAMNNSTMNNDMSDEEAQDVNLPDRDDSETYEITPPDADDYFAKNANVISEISAEDSNEVLTETEVCDMLEGRGFGDYPITTEYSMSGEYFEASEISASSATKHPIYQTYFVTSGGDSWTLYIINDFIMAEPLSYNVQSGNEVQTLISESETLTSYDSTTNKFYETIPNETMLLVKTVSRIDAKTLEELTNGAIDGL
jgi:hypothetical protein